QIVKFTFDNAGLDFLPLAWLARVSELKASMLMSEAFPGVWLPKRIDSSGAIVMAPGRFDISYSLEYSGYREATVSTRIRGPVRVTSGGASGQPPRVTLRSRINFMFVPILNAEDGYGLSYGVNLAIAGNSLTAGRLVFPLSWGGDKRAGVEYQKELNARFAPA